MNQGERDELLAEIGFLHMRVSKLDALARAQAVRITELEGQLRTQTPEPPADEPT